MALLRCRSGQFFPAVTDTAVALPRADLARAPGMKDSSCDSVVLNVRRPFPFPGRSLPEHPLLGSSSCRLLRRQLLSRGPGRARLFGPRATHALTRALGPPTMTCLVLATPWQMAGGKGQELRAPTTGVEPRLLRPSEPPAPSRGVFLPPVASGRAVPAPSGDTRRHGGMCGREGQAGSRSGFAPQNRARRRRPTTDGSAQPRTPPVPGSVPPHAPPPPPACGKGRGAESPPTRRTSPHAQADTAACPTRTARRASAGRRGARGSRVDAPTPRAAARLGRWPRGAPPSQEPGGGRGEGSRALSRGGLVWPRGVCAHVTRADTARLRAPGPGHGGPRPSSRGASPGGPGRAPVLTRTTGGGRAAAGARPAPA